MNSRIFKKKMNSRIFKKKMNNRIFKKKMNSRIFKKKMNSRIFKKKMYSRIFKKKFRTTMRNSYSTCMTNWSKAEKTKEDEEKQENLQFVQSWLVEKSAARRSPEVPDTGNT